MTAVNSSQNSPAGLQPGSTFGSYRVVRCIGIGGMGAVFEGVHELLSRRVAIKVLHAKSAEKPEARERFLREAQSVARIRHPNVVEIFDVGVIADQPYLVMEYLEGESLDVAMDRMTPMDEQRATSVLVPIAAALAAVHGAGLVHRDVKPENIFLSTDSKGHFVPKLVDFGIAKDLSAPISGSHHTVIGTPHFMSPEQARGSLSLDARTDQYSFAVMLYQLLTGAMPYDADSLLELVRAIDTGNFVPPRALNPSITPEFEAVLMRAMSRDATARFPTMRDLGRALSPFASERLRVAFAADFGEETAGGAAPVDRGWPEPPVSGEMRRPVIHPMSTTTTLDKMMRPAHPVGTDTTSGEISIRPLAPTTAFAPATEASPPVAEPAASSRPRVAIAALALVVIALLGLLASRVVPPSSLTGASATDGAAPAVVTPQVAPSGSEPAVSAEAPSSPAGEALPSAAATDAPAGEDVGARVEAQGAPPGTTTTSTMRQSAVRRPPMESSVMNEAPAPSMSAPSLGIRLER